jgi:hypothetical protein
MNPAIKGRRRAERAAMWLLVLRVVVFRALLPFRRFADPAGFHPNYNYDTIELDRRTR